MDDQEFSYHFLQTGFSLALILLVGFGLATGIFIYRESHQPLPFDSAHGMTYARFFTARLVQIRSQPLECQEFHLTSYAVGALLMPPFTFRSPTWREAPVAWWGMVEKGTWDTWGKAELPPALSACRLPPP